MESIIRNVKDIASDERRVYESVLGHILQDDQQILIHVVEPSDEAMRRAALKRAAEIARQGRAAAAAQGIAPEEADRLIDEAIRQVRQANR